MVIVAIAGYLLGSIPTALIVGRLAGVDPRQRGDRNPGWWNMRGLVGEARAAFVLFGDLTKGALAATIGSLMWGPWWIAYLALLFSMIGNAFPLFGDFRGGRSAVTWAGGMFVLAPIPALLATLTGAIFWLGSRRPVNGIRAGVLSLPLIQALFAPRIEVLVTCGLLGFVALRFLFAQGFPALRHQGSPATSS